MEEKKTENKKKLDLSKYEPIRDKETIDHILSDMKKDKIFPSDALKGFILQRIQKINVQKYLIEKFQETKDKIEKKISKRNKGAKK